MRHILRRFGAVLLIFAAVPAAIAADRTTLTQNRAASAQVPPDVFGSVAMPLRHSRYDERWQRVLRQTSSPQLPGLIQPATSLGRDQQVRFVNASMNRYISYRFDTGPSGDRWASVNETLEKRAGDCEDIVIAKLQALRALGVPVSNLYMTIGYEGTDRSVHALLLVRLANRLWVLDNRTDRLVTQEEYKDFYPVLTFSGGSTWTHGYRPGKTPVAVAAMTLTLNGRNLPLGSNVRSASWSGVRR
jgi:predicted transglutaminase-like cysteine proteinase